MEEIWKDVKGYEGMYQVSNLGRVKSLERQIVGIKSKYIGERILKQSPDGKGYMMAWLYFKNKRTTVKVHRLVAEAFIPNPENKPQIDHINTVKTDNNVANLRWCTEKENSCNPITAKRNGEAHYRDKGKCNSKVLQMSMDGEPIKEWICMSDVKRELGIQHSHIVGCCKGSRKSAGGFKWKYIGESRHDRKRVRKGS